MTKIPLLVIAGAIVTQSVGTQLLVTRQNSGCVQTPPFAKRQAPTPKNDGDYWYPLDDKGEYQDEKPDQYERKGNLGTAISDDRLEDRRENNDNFWEAYSLHDAGSYHNGIYHYNVRAEATISQKKNRMGALDENVYRQRLLFVRFDLRREDEH